MSLGFGMVIRSRPVIHGPEELDFLPKACAYGDRWLFVSLHLSTVPGDWKSWCSSKQSTQYFFCAYSVINGHFPTFLFLLDFSRFPIPPV